MEPERQAAVKQGSEALVEDAKQPALRQVAPRVAVGAVAHQIQEWTERVVADDQIRTLLNGDVDIGRVTEAAIHVVDPSKSCRPEEAGKSARCLNGL